MAKLKPYLRYWQIDANILSSRDIMKLIRRINKLQPGAGQLSVLVYIIIECTIVRNNDGYYIHLDDDLITDIANEINIEETFVSLVIDECLQIGLFDPCLGEQRILTSISLQRAYFEIMKKYNRVITVGPYCLITNELEASNSSKENNHSYKEYRHSSKKSWNSSKEPLLTSKGNPSVLSKHQDSSEESADSSEESLHPSEIGTQYRKVKYSKVKEGITRARENNPPPPQLNFHDEYLNDYWNQLLLQPLWSNKTPEGIRIAFDLLSRYEPFVAAQMIKHTISSELKEVYPPKDEMFLAARQEKELVFRQNHQKKVSPSVLSFGYLTSAGSDPKDIPIISDIRETWRQIKSRATNEIEDSLMAVTFEITKDYLHLIASQDVIDWCTESDALSAFAKFNRPIKTITKA